MWPAAEIAAEDLAEFPENLVEVGCFSSPAAAADRGLVILSMGLPYWLQTGDGQFSLLVEPQQAAEVRAQLAKYELESAHWPPPLLPAPQPHSRSGFLITIWALMLLVSFWAQQRWPGWTQTGSLQPAGVFDHGEFWRPLTALFLHGDVGHLLSNALAGAFVFSAVFDTLGRRRGILLLALAGVLGNLLSAAAHLGGPYLSIGASTAVFAGLGLLTGRAITWHRTPSAPTSLRRIFAPLGAGVTILALYGAGGAHVDLGAHLCGFVTGLALGQLPRRL
jgi:membrane associated rhomboid family serine protease